MCVSIHEVYVIMSAITSVNFFFLSLFDVCTYIYIRRCTKPPPFPRKKDIKNPIISFKKKEPANYISSLTRFRCTYALNSEVSSSTS